MDGNIRFFDGLGVDGVVIGHVSGKADQASILMISDLASVTGEICADHIIVNSLVTGPVYARVLLELQPKAGIGGDIRYVALELHQGAIISGQLRPSLASDEKPTLKLAANSG